MNPIKTRAELIQAMAADRTLRLYWHAGARPSAPGSYRLQAGTAQPTVVYAKAVNGLNDRLQRVRGDWNHAVYRLTSKTAAA